MNREIKFRGKSIDEWVYGMLIKVNEGDTEHREPLKYSIQTDEKEYGEYNKYFITDDNTIGQFTGLHDKNGREIYEGDILKSIRWNNIYLVKHTGTAFYLCRKGNNGFNKITTWNNAENSEIIGNIYDNPELLGGE